MGHDGLDPQRAYWDSWVDLFERTVEPSTLIAARTLYIHLRLQEAQAILEVGAGPGAAACAIHSELRPDVRLVVTDFAPQMVARARARLPDTVEVMEANAEALPFEDGTFDRLFSNLTLMVLPDPYRALSEACRVLRPGGLAAWSVWGHAEKSTMFTLPVQAAQRSGLTLPSEGHSNFRLNDRDALREQLRRHGFSHSLTWYQTLAMPVKNGAHFAEVTFQSPRWQPILTAHSAELQAKFRHELENAVDTQLAAGDPVTLDVLMIVAER